MQGAGRRLDREHRERAWLAHTLGMLTRLPPKKYPKLDDLCRVEKNKPEPQTPDQMLLIAHMWNAAIAAQTFRK